MPRPAPLSARVTSADTSVRAPAQGGYQGRVGLLAAAGKSRKGTEKSFKRLQKTAIRTQRLTSAGPKSFWFLPSLRSQRQGWDRAAEGEVRSPSKAFGTRSALRGGLARRLGDVPCPGSQRVPRERCWRTTWPKGIRWTLTPRSGERNWCLCWNL